MIRSTNKADEADKLNVCEQLQSEVAATPKHDVVNVLILVGDLNAKVGSGNT